MISKTRGIVLKQIKFSDSGVIVKIFTEEFGVRPFFVRGINSGRSGKKAALYQPLMIINIIAKISEKKSIHNIVDSELCYNYKTINDDMKKRSLLIFINELLYKCLQEESNNNELFNWIYNSLVWLDMKDSSYVNFHLLFMLQLSKFLGFFPSINSINNNTIFDLEDGQFTDKEPTHPNYVSGTIASIIYELLTSTYDSMGDVNLNREQRGKVIDTLIAYYHLHIPMLGDFKSLEILKVVLT